MAQLGTWTITVAGQDNPLCTYDDAVKVEPVSGGKSIMAVNGYGALRETFIDLGNIMPVRKFTMTREHDTNTDATSWYMIDGLAYEGVADVTIAHTDYSGVETDWLITGAKVEITIDEPIGVTTTTHITITGGPAVVQP